MVNNANNARCSIADVNMFIDWTHVVWNGEEPHDLSLTW